MVTKKCFIFGVLRYDIAVWPQSISKNVNKFIQTNLLNVMMWVELIETKCFMHEADVACFPLCRSAYLWDSGWTSAIQFVFSESAGADVRLWWGRGDGLQGETQWDRRELSWKRDSSTLTVIEIFYQNTFSQPSLIINPPLIEETPTVVICCNAFQIQ